MATITWYGDGTATATTGSKVVTGTGTGWLSSVGGLTPIKVGDKFGLHVGRPIVIEAIVSDTELLLTDDWPGPDQTDAPYKVELTNPAIAAVEAMRRLLAQLANGTLAGISEVDIDLNELIIGAGPGTFTTINKAQLANGAHYDVQVDNLAARAAYDASATGFAVLVSDIGDGRSALYSKRSATSGDWTDPAIITGEGEPGPYTEFVAGTTTTLSPGQPATFTFTEVSPGVMRIDAGIPRGTNGTGAGDVVGPAGGVSNSQIAGFLGTDGKAIKGLTLAEARVAVGGVPVTGYISPGFNLSNNVSDATNDLNFPAGVVASSAAFPILMAHAAAVAQLDVAYGTGNGGRFDAAIADGTWHCFIISNGAVVSRGFSQSLDPTSQPNYPSGFTHFRRIASWIRRSGALIQMVQDEDDFLFLTSILERQGQTQQTDTLLTITTPLGIVVRPKLEGYISVATSGNIQNAMSTPGNPLIVFVYGSLAGDRASLFINGQFSTNLLSQIRFALMIYTGTVTNSTLINYGWIDNRGRA